MPLTPASTERIQIGVSSCLVGERVRYDGDLKRDVFISDNLGDVFELIPVCPEVAIGMGVPRPPIRLVGDATMPRALGVDDPNLDVTASLTDFGRHMAAELGDISAYIFKSRSPSCGPSRVRLYREGKAPCHQVAGLYAREIMAHQPLLPIEDEERLAEPLLRDNFIERIFAYRRWQQLMSSGFTPSKLIEFHSRNKLTLMAHSATYYRTLGQLVSSAKAFKPQHLVEQYGNAFMTALKHTATRKRHTNVLQHLMGYLKKHIDHADKGELLEVIDAYRLGMVTLIMPLTLLRHHFRRYPQPYIENQTYLYPDPLEIKLRFNN
jgi:uncharacterized protein YbgA (DUF1722 family)/uncharacterized protein YbbK (DUF523 family)